MKKENIFCKVNIACQNTRGITLTILAVIISLLLILAGATITIAINGGGIFGKAGQAREEWNTSIATEEQKGSEVWQKLDTKLVKTVARDASGANAPVLPEGNMEVYYLTWDANGNEIPSETEPTTEWHNYNEGKWANIKTVNGTGNEAYWVWIPRFAYKIPTRPTSSTYTGNPTFEIAFLDGASNIPVNASDLNGGSVLMDTSAGVEVGQWVVHPAFNWGGTPLKGIWVGKFEASKNSNKVNVKPNVTSWTYITINDMFTNCQAMTSAGEVLEGTIKADPHMMKNVEWGAVAYLTQSKYGQMRTDGNGQVWINPSCYRTTGQAGTGANVTNTEITNNYNKGNGPKASTTGNVYGIYDMSGGTWEYVAAYVKTVGASGNYANVNTYISNLRTAAGNVTTSKYVDTYEIGASESQQNNYNALVNGNKIQKWGDAIYETSYGYNGEYSWQKDYSQFPMTTSPVFRRGGHYNRDFNAGLFCFDNFNGNRDVDSGFRPVFVAQ